MESRCQNHRVIVYVFFLLFFQTKRFPFSFIVQYMFRGGGSLSVNQFKKVKKKSEYKEQRNKNAALYARTL